MKFLSLIVGSLSVLAASVSVADVPMTKWGKPSLQGTWDFRTVTPFQRPASFADKEFLTPDEVAEVAKGERADPPKKPENNYGRGSI